MKCANCGGRVYDKFANGLCGTCIQNFLETVTFKEKDN